MWVVVFLRCNAIYQSPTKQKSSRIDKISLRVHVLARKTHGIILEPGSIPTAPTTPTAPSTIPKSTLSTSKRKFPAIPA